MSTVHIVRKVAAILSADVVGYSRLMGDDDVATIGDMIATRRLMAASVESHGGRLVDTAGDSMLADFKSPTEALQCAIDVQRQLRQRNAGRPPARRMLLRIGLNLGDIIEQDTELYGDAVNIAARLQALGEPGGVCVSSSVHDLVEGRLPLAFRYAGEQSVKNIAKPVRVYHVELDTPDAAPAVRADSAIGQQREPSHHLPRPLSSFIGRATETAAVATLSAHNRLVTLVGPGGVGKTRLAIHVAATVTARHPDGAWFVELGALSDPRTLPQAVADALGVKEQPGRPLVDALVDAIGDRRMLLVLDNCEHLVDACAALAAFLLRHTGGLTLLATSREPLHVTGEVAYPVPALALPASPAAQSLEELSAFEAIQLFVERAQARQPAFALSSTNAAEVVRICRRLDGIPLAIELAAARAHTLPVEQIAARLDDRFRLLVGSGRDVLPRQQTLRALIDWSHDLLTAEERVLLRRLAVFAGGWTLDASEAVCAGDPIDDGDVLDLLGRLVDKSLVAMDPTTGRYRLLETVRQYAFERLEAAGEADLARQRHLAHYLALAEAAKPQLAGPEQASWLRRLDAEQENLLAAHAWCDRAEQGAQAGLLLIGALKRYWFNRGRLLTLIDATGAALRRPGAEARNLARCHVLHAAGQAAYRLGDYEGALGHLHEALSIARELREDLRAASILQELGMTSLGRGDFAAAQGHLLESVDLARRSGDKRELAAAINALAQLHRMQNELDAAEPLYEQALLLMRELRDRENLAVAALNLAMVATGRADAQRARHMLLLAHEIGVALQSELTGQYVIAVASGLAAIERDWRRVATFFGAAHAEGERTGIRFDPADVAFLEPLWERARMTDPAGFAAAEASGRAMSYADAMTAVGRWLTNGGAAKDA